MPRGATRLLDRSVMLMGARFPLPPLLIAAATLCGSIFAAVGLRTGLPFVRALVLQPDLVWHGQAWRLLTWPFFELDPISLLFACLVILFFGRDLSYRWGPAWFFAAYAGLTLVAGLGTCLLAWVWPELRVGTYAGAWPLADAVIIAWAIEFPTRQMLLYFVLPLGGRILIYGIVGLTLLMALFGGFAPYVPHFLAEAATLIYLRGLDLRGLFGRMRRTTGWSPPSGRRSKLRIIDRGPGDEPPRWLH